MSGISLPQVYYSIGEAICRFPVNFPDMNLEAVSLKNGCFLKDQVDRVEFLAMAADMREGTLYLADNLTNTISRVHLGDLSSDIIIGGTGVVEGNQIIFR